MRFIIREHEIVRIGKTYGIYPTTILRQRWTEKELFMSFGRTPEEARERYLKKTAEKLKTAQNQIKALEEGLEIASSAQMQILPVDSIRQKEQKLKRQLSEGKIRL